MVAIAEYPTTVFLMPQCRASVADGHTSDLLTENVHPIFPGLTVAVAATR